MSDSLSSCETVSANQQPILHFASLPEESLQALRANLSLSMSVARLSLCAELFRAAHRDPLPDELRFLDELCAGFDRLPEVRRIGDFQTDDEETARLFADLVLKTTPARGARQPLSLAAAMNAAGDAAARSGIRVPFADRQMGYSFAFAADDADVLSERAGAAPIQSLSIEGTPYRLSVRMPIGESCDASARTDDLVSFLPLEDGDVPEETRQKCRSLLRDPSLFYVFLVTKGELLPAVLQFPGGLLIDLLSIPGLPEGMTDPAKIVGNTPRGFVIVAGKNATHSLMSRASACGLTVAAFAQIKSGSSVTFAPRCQLTLKLSKRFLRRLLTVPAANCDLSHTDSPVQDAPTRNHDSLVCSASAFERHVLCPAGKTATLCGFRVRHTTLILAPDTDGRSLTDALCKTVTRLVADGGDARETFLSVGLSLAQDTPDRTLWSFVLALHRLQAAWNLPSLPPVLLPAAPGEPSELTLVLAARAQAAPTTQWARAGRTVQLLSPFEDGKTLADPAEAYRRLRTLSALVGDGQVGALAAVVSATPAEVLDTMTTDSLCLPARQDDETYQTYLVPKPCSFIAELAIPFDGGITLGETASDDDGDTSSEPSEPFAIPASRSRVHHEHPRVLLPQTPGDASLIPCLRGEGAIVETVPLTATLDDQIAYTDALARAQIAILGDVRDLRSILSQQHVQASFRNFFRNGGVLLATGGAGEALCRTGYLGSTAQATYRWDATAGFAPAITQWNDSRLLPIRPSAAEDASVRLPHGCAVIAPENLPARSPNDEWQAGADVIPLAGYGDPAEDGTLHAVRLCCSTQILVFCDGFDREQLLDAIRYFR